MERKQKIWEEEENQYLIKNCRSVKDIPKAIKKLGRTAASIRGHIDYISENRELIFFEKGKANWNVAEEKKLEKMYNEGLTAKEIAKVLGRTKSAINNHTNLLGLKRKRKRRSDADLPAPVKTQDIIKRDKWNAYREKKHQENIKKAIEVGTWFCVYESNVKVKELETNKVEYVVAQKCKNFAVCHKKTKNGVVIKKCFQYMDIYNILKNTKKGLELKEA